MTTTAEKIEIMQAFEDGTNIEHIRSSSSDTWYNSPTPAWNWDSYIYRIKPKAKRKLYLWAFTQQISPPYYWSQTSRYFPDENEVKRCLTTITELNRLDHTMIEVD